MCRGSHLMVRVSEASLEQVSEADGRSEGYMCWWGSMGERSSLWHCVPGSRGRWRGALVNSSRASVFFFFVKKKMFPSGAICEVYRFFENVKNWLNILSKTNIGNCFRNMNYGVSIHQTKIIRWLYSFHFPVIAGLCITEVYMHVYKGKVLYGQELSSRESTTSECGVNYQLLSVIYWSSPMGNS